jgi:hypothetical protein
MEEMREIRTWKMKEGWKMMGEGRRKIGRCREEYEGRMDDAGEGRGEREIGI